MVTLLVKNAAVIATMDGERREISDGGLFVENGWITRVGPMATLPQTADSVVDASGHLVLPGLVNTHHHMYQTLTRGVPGAQNAGLFDWLRTLYPIWAYLTSQDVVTATRTALAELALSGCTTAFDHQYLWPNQSSVDDQVRAAGDIGLRFHASRGSMSLSEKDGGLPPDSVVQTEEEILADTERVIDAHHDSAPGAMVRVVVAPCSPFSVTMREMRSAAELARAKGVHLHTHLAETSDEDEFCMATYGMRPVELAEDVGWMGDDVWFAHGVHINPAEVARMGVAGTGVAHCPTSNMRIASGIAPVAGYRAAGVRTGLGVDGSASNDSSHLLAEARQALMLNRLAVAPGVGEGPQLTARQALELATIGGAAVLGRDDIGSLQAGKAADFVTIDLDRLEYAGSEWDPVAAAVLFHPTRVSNTYVHGRAVVRHGRLVTADEEQLAADHRAATRRLMDVA
jgi:cytosine/adenosine deaminase-related metal-dependent hydrolase